MTYLLALPRAGSTSSFYSPGLDSTPQLSSENRVLREENHRLQAQLSHVSRGECQKPQTVVSVVSLSSLAHPSPIGEAKREGRENRATQTHQHQTPLAFLTLERAIS